MPFYDYKCGECGHTEERNHSIHEDPDFKCIECGSAMSINIGSNVPMIKFKGYGWPGDDSKKANRLKKSNMPKDRLK